MVKEKPSLSTEIFLFLKKMNRGSFMQSTLLRPQPLLRPKQRQRLGQQLLSRKRRKTSLRTPWRSKQRLPLLLPKTATTIQQSTTTRWQKTLAALTFR